MSVVRVVIGNFKSALEQKCTFEAVAFAPTEKSANDTFGDIISAKDSVRFAVGLRFDTSASILQVSTAYIIGRNWNKDVCRLRRVHKG